MATTYNNFRLVQKYTGSYTVFRSAAPGYNSKKGDQEQVLTQGDVDFLVREKINGIISFNQYPYSAESLLMLAPHGIVYLHFPTKDYQAPLEEQLKASYEFVIAPGRTATLIHCGAGYGRTGTGVTAVQLHINKGTAPLEAVWETENDVEEPVQMDMLRLIRDRYLQPNQEL